MQGHPLPRPAPYLRHHRAGARYGRENALHHHRTYLLGDYHRYLQPHHRRHAAAGRAEDRARDRPQRGVRAPRDARGPQLPAEDGKPPVRPPFAPYKGKVRKPGTGGIYELNDHLFEGRYSPTNAQGKREVHTVYAKTKEECEVRLETMIAEVRERIKEEKQRVKDASGGSEDVPE